jgi:hypothetical protein
MSHVRHELCSMKGTNSSSIYDCLLTPGFKVQLYASNKIFTTLRYDPENPHTPLSACLRRIGSPTSQILCSSLGRLTRAKNVSKIIWGSKNSEDF